MNSVLAAACLFITILFIPATINCISIPETRARYKIGDTVILTGDITSSTYLSRSDNSNVEHFNTAYILRLGKSIDISDDRDTSKNYKDINNIEIENHYKFEMRGYSGRKARVRGILKTFSKRPGYYRQYSTPVKIEIIEINPGD